MRRWLIAALASVVGCAPDPQVEAEYQRRQAFASAFVARNELQDLGTLFDRHDVEFGDGFLRPGAGITPSFPGAPGHMFGARAMMNGAALRLRSPHPRALEIRGFVPAPATSTIELRRDGELLGSAPVDASRHFVLVVDGVGAPAWGAFELTVVPTPSPFFDVTTITAVRWMPAPGEAAWGAP